MKTETLTLREAAAGMMRELRRLRDTQPAAWDALVDAGLCTAWDGLKAALAAPDPTREALEILTVGFRARPEKQELAWSLGYWEGVDPGLALVNGGEAPFLENTDFHPVVRFSPDEIKAALAAMEATKEEKQEEKRS